MDKIRFEEKFEDLLGRYQNESESERKEYKVSNSYYRKMKISYIYSHVLFFIHTLFQDIIHEKDGKHKDLHKKMADIRREHNEVKRVVSWNLRSKGSYDWNPFCMLLL